MVVRARQIAITDGVLRVPRRVVLRFGRALRRRTPVVNAECADIDRRFGIETALPVPLHKMSLPDRVYPDAVEYQPTPPSVFTRILKDLPVQLDRFTFVDVGCGKGLVLLLAADHPFERIVGIDCAPEMCAQALRNLSGYCNPGQRCHSIDILCMDAGDYSFPQKELVIYLFNPFGVRVIRRVLTNLFARGPQETWIVYYNPVFWKDLDKSPNLIRHIATESYIIYRSKKPLVEV
jgi:SAM-dependent methyltransferase